jgi:hypothetical protein
MRVGTMPESGGLPQRSLESTANLELLTNDRADSKQKENLISPTLL